MRRLVAAFQNSDSQKIPLADRHAIVAKDGVGGGDMEKHIR